MVGIFECSIDSVFHKFGEFIDQVNGHNFNIRHINYSMKSLSFTHVYILYIQNVSGRKSW
jgi:hypothetical protein